MALRRETLGILIAVLAAFIFGFYPPGTRGAYAAGANAGFMILFTVFCRAASLYLFCRLTGRQVFKTRRETKIAALNGVFQILSVIGIIGGMAFIPGPVVITIMFTYTVLLYLFMVLKREEKLEALTLVSVLAALCGLAVVVNAQNRFENLSLIGLGLAAMAALATMSRMYLYGKSLKTGHPAVVGAEIFIFTLLFSLPLAFYQTPVLPATPEGWGWALMAAASLSLGNFAMFYGIAMIGSFKFAFFIKLEPVFGAILSVLLISEILSPTQYLGMAVVIGSLVFYQHTQSRKARRIAGTAGNPRSI